MQMTLPIPERDLVPRPARHLYAPGSHVRIYHNDEAGIWQHSVFNVNDPEYWLDSFRTRDDALAFVERGGFILID